MLVRFRKGKDFKFRYPSYSELFSEGNHRVRPPCKHHIYGDVFTVRLPQCCEYLAPRPVGDFCTSYDKLISGLGFVFSLAIRRMKKETHSPLLGPMTARPKYIDPVHSVLLNGQGTATDSWGYNTFGVPYPPPKIDKRMKRAFDTQFNGDSHDVSPAYQGPTPGWLDIMGTFDPWRYTPGRNLRR